MKLFLLILAIPYSCIAVSQKRTDTTSSSKGHWNFPIEYVETIDTTTKDCFGMPANSPYLTLKSQSCQDVRAIRRGRVVTVVDSGTLHIIIIRFENFFLTYVDVIQSTAKPGDHIEAGATIGKMTKDGETNECSLTIMLMRGSRTININRWFDWAARKNVAQRGTSVP